MVHARDYEAVVSIGNRGVCLGVYVVVSGSSLVCSKRSWPNLGPDKRQKDDTSHVELSHDQLTALHVTWSGQLTTRKAR